ncbi:Receptor activity-modifying protein 1 [Merluccius polli]|uniref:Receptor activity-modifying protein 1 n=1 Tax=Merluccius polli TaxID=89951 RepID=A0AA47M3Y3_MERPO|nr:Receptor activity-modifying protein 1 [Merluccius polli]
MATARQSSSRLSTTMLVHLLLTTLVSGIHSGNVTIITITKPNDQSGLEPVEAFSKHVEFFFNIHITINVNPEGTVEPNLDRSIWDDLADREVGLYPNLKLNLTAEDNESFQEQEQLYPHRYCYQEELEKHSHSLCGLVFQQSMEAIGVEHWCSFDKVMGAYNNLTTCMEILSSILNCYYPIASVQTFFLHVHNQYFLPCSQEELLFDAPHTVVVVLTLVPVTIIPLLVYLVVWKSNGRE